MYVLCIYACIQIAVQVAGEASFQSIFIESMPSWHIRGIVYMTSILDIKDTEIEMCRRRIYATVHNVAFQNGFFMLLINRFDFGSDELGTEEIVQKLMRGFGVAQLSAIYPSRFACGIVNVRHGVNDPELNFLSQWASNYFDFV